MNFSMESTVGQILDNDAARGVIAKYVGDAIFNHPMLELAKGMTLSQVANHVDSLSQETLAAIDGELRAL